MTANGFDPERTYRPTSLTGLTLVAASVLLSILARTATGDTVRIRWSIGTYYGPEYAPAALVLGTFPLAAAALYAGFRLLGRYLERTDAFDDDARTVYEASALATLGMVLLVQVLIVAANLL